MYFKPPPEVVCVIGLQSVLSACWRGIYNSSFCDWINIQLKKMHEVANCKQAKEFKVLLWPSNYPEFNLIEHL